MRCESCAVTHAIIPSFSVPGRSIGTNAVDSFLDQLQKGNSQKQSGICFIENGMNADYYKSLLKSLHISSLQLSAILCAFGLETSTCLSPLGLPLKKITILNRISLALGFNAIYFSRRSILSYDSKRKGKAISLNMHSTVLKLQKLDSS